VVSHLESMGVPSLNRAQAIARARDKLLALQILVRHEIDVPRTVLARPPEPLGRALELVGGPPVVLKLLHGTQGVGVILAETRAAAEATLDTLWGLGHDVMIQEFVSESRGRDVRALVIGGRVIAAMRRQARRGEWRSNLHRGGTGASLSLEPAFERAALESTRALGLDVAGVDLLEGRDGPRVIEVNASPGFEGLERVTGIDIAGAIVRQAEQIARPTPLEVDRFTG
jgi:ribosomal protein S6--L-glutamate ligase